MCPPGVDQTTRSPQRWNILAPLIQERIDLTEDFAVGRRTNLANFLIGDYTWDAFDKLASRTANDSGDHEKLLSELSQTNNSRQASPLESLPNELLAMIFNDGTLTANDVLAIGLCSKTLWQCCMGHVRAVVSKGPWMKTPLVCAGTYLTDLPSTVHEIVPSLKQREEDWRARQPPPGHGMRGGRGMCPARRWNWNAVSTYTDTSDDSAMTWLSAFDSVCCNEQSGISVTDQKLLRHSLRSLLSAGKPKSNSKWILRNHSTQQYVHLRCSSNVVAETELRVKGLPALTLDKALMMRICWTTTKIYPSGKGGEGKDLRGLWAGHRFDVVGDDHDQSKALGEQWQDVTEDVVKEWKERKNEPSTDA